VLANPAALHASRTDLLWDLTCAFDPAELMRRCGLPPDDWQREVLRSPTDRVLLCCSRQSGKSTVAAVMALHTALYHPPALVLLLSPSLRQGQELFKIVARLYTALGTPTPLLAESALRVEFQGGSRIVSLPGTEETVRGYSGVKLLVVDEAAQVDDALYYSVRPCPPKAWDPIVRALRRKGFLGP
jgi:helicase-like protein